MKILHYSLGVSPQSSGGLTVYFEDLIGKLNLEFNQDIIILTPKDSLFNMQNNTIKYNGSLDSRNRIDHFNLLTNIRIPLTFGIKNPKEYYENIVEYAKCEENFRLFFLKKNIKKIHLHTLMGLPKGFFTAANSLGIELYYTTHDYFGICPKVNLMKYNGDICKDYKEGEECSKCNENAISDFKISVSQSKIVSNFKKYTLFKKITNNLKPKNNNQEIFLNIQSNIEVKNGDKEKSFYFKKIREFYIEIFNKIDIMHFNSQLAEEVFSEYLNIDSEKKKIISISNLTIESLLNRRIKKDLSIKNETTKFTFLGPYGNYKGLPFLLDCLKELDTNEKWMLSIHGDDSKIKIPQKIKDNVIVNNRYSRNELSSLLKNTDFLIVPSLWPETFGFIALEAIALGIPVIMSEHVGSKMIIEKKFPELIFSGKNELLNILKDVLKNNNKIYTKFNSEKFDISFEEHCKKIIKMYEGEQN